MTTPAYEPPTVLAQKLSAHDTVNIYHLRRGDNALVHDAGDQRLAFEPKCAMCRTLGREIMEDLTSLGRSATG